VFTRELALRFILINSIHSVPNV